MAIYVDEKYFPILAACGEVRNYPEGSTIFVQEEKADEVYIIESGRVRAGASTKDGRELTFEVLMKGRIFGDASFLSHSVRSASITAITDARIIVCTTDALIPLLQEHKDLLMIMLQHLTDTCSTLAHQLIRSNLFTAEQKIADLLLQLKKDFRKDIPYTHEDIAESLGLNRVTASRILHRMKDTGIIDYAYGTIHILDTNKLKHILNNKTSIH